MSMWTDTFFVSCRSCGYHHDTNMIKSLNIEEDIQGADVLTFSCPDTGEIVSSWVFRDYREPFSPEYN